MYNSDQNIMVILNYDDIITENFHFQKQLSIHVMMILSTQGRENRNKRCKEFSVLDNGGYYDNLLS
jgi:hypothetical protein